MLRKRQGWILRSAIGLLLIGCVPTTPPTAPATVAVPQQPLAHLTISESEAIPQLIVAERYGAAAHNLELLANLWVPEGRIVDGRSSADPTDDYVWEGRNAILDRYILAVFPGPSTPLDIDDLALGSIVVKGDQATLTYGQDQWTFVRRDGRWWILELRYSQ